MIKMKKNSKKTIEKSFAISGIFLMVMSVFAISIILSEIDFVDAEEPSSIMTFVTNPAKAAFGLKQP